MDSEDRQRLMKVYMSMDTVELNRRISLDDRLISALEKSIEKTEWIIANPEQALAQLQKFRDSVKDTKEEQNVKKFVLLDKMGMIE